MPAFTVAAIPIWSALIGGGTALAGSKMASSAANNAAKTQTQAATEAARINAQSQREALAVAKEQQDYERRMAAPYQAASQGALTRLSDLLGFEPAQLAPSSSATSARSQATDPSYITSQINAGFQQRYGRPPTDKELAQWTGYATKPDIYSDGMIRQGWNAYLNDRLVNPNSAAGSSVDPGMDTVIGRAPQTSGMTTIASLLTPQTSGVAPSRLQSLADVDTSPSTDVDMVVVQSPSGQRYHVPKSRLSEALAQGGRQVA